MGVPWAVRLADLPRTVHSLPVLLGGPFVPQVDDVRKARMAGAERLVGVVGEERDTLTRKDLNR